MYIVYVNKKAVYAFEWLSNFYGKDYVMHLYGFLILMVLSWPLTSDFRWVYVRVQQSSESRSHRLLTIMRSIEVNICTENEYK